MKPHFISNVSQISKDEKDELVRELTACRNPKGAAVDITHYYKVNNSAPIAIIVVLGALQIDLS